MFLVARRQSRSDDEARIPVSDSDHQVNLTVQRFAVLTCIVSLLPISVGALVTTLKAGMAFADWPTSDGHNMLLYPWLRDLRHTDKFVEHGHRLAGMLIGFVAILLVVVTFRKESRRSVRLGAVAILIAVIGQGLLGGMRVRMDEQVLAMTHSITGGLFFTLCFLFALAVRRSTDSSIPQQPDQRLGPATLALTVVLPLAVLCQYILGGFFRHLGQMLHEHIAGAVIVTLLTLSVLSVVIRSNAATLRKRGRWLGLALLVQLGLGLGSWVTKMGFPTFGWVATANSPAQNIVCSLHTVGGMFLLATSSATALEVVLLTRSGLVEGVSDLMSAGKTLATDQKSGGFA